MEQIPVKCKIEHHAMLFAFLSKCVITDCGERGKETIIDAITQYGEERGRRMAANAIKNGDQLNLLNNQAYGEWMPDYPGQMEFGRVCSEPTLITYIRKCAWCDAWRKHDMMEYGKYYCVTIDDAVYRGFHESFRCEPRSRMSWGDKSCEFDWGAGLNTEEVKELDRKKQQLGDRFMRDFNFHTAHLFYTVSGKVIKQLGEAGEAAVKKAVKDYCGLFGTAYFEVLSGLYP